MPRASTAEGARVHFWCPGCDEAHGITYEGPQPWEWNRDLERPTFSPSILVGGIQWNAEVYPYFQRRRDRHPNVPVGGRIVCHSFVKEGRIQFLGDSTHTLSGQTVDLPEWPYGGDL